jgi:hypothetical protein
MTLPTIVVIPAPKNPYEWHLMMPYNLGTHPKGKKFA